MKLKIIIGLLFLLLLVTACTPEQEARARELIGQHRCATFNGYLCSAPDDCALPYLDTIESYCCPIKCNTCNQSCDDGNPCTNDVCGKDTGYKCENKNISICIGCKYRMDENICSGRNDTIICKGGKLISCADGNKCTADSCTGPTNAVVEVIGKEEAQCEHNELKPCPNNGICEMEEFKGDLHTYCPSSAISGGAGIAAVEEVARPVSSVESSDCPTTCNDDNSNTEDWYDFDAQICKHKQCETAIPSSPTIQVCGDGSCNNNENTANCPDDCKLTSPEPNIISITDNLGNTNTNSWATTGTGDWPSNMKTDTSGNYCDNCIVKIGDKITFSIKVKKSDESLIEYSCYINGLFFKVWNSTSDSESCDWIVSTTDYGINQVVHLKIKNNNGLDYLGLGHGDDYTYAIYKVIE